MGQKMITEECNELTGGYDFASKWLELAVFSCHIRRQDFYGWEPEHPFYFYIPVTQLAKCLLLARKRT